MLVDILVQNVPVQYWNDWKRDDRNTGYAEMEKNIF